MDVLDYTRNDDYLLVHVTKDDFSLNEVTRVASDFRSNLISMDYPDTIFDLSEVKYIDTSGIGLLVNTNKLLTRRESKLYLVCNNMALLDFMKIIKLETLMKIFPTVDEAVRFIKDDKY